MAGIIEEFIGDLGAGEVGIELPSIGDGIGSFLNTFNPLAWFQQGQARDEARQVRADDIARDEKWLERNSVGGRIREGMSHGLSLSAAAGLQGSMAQPTAIGQSNSEVNVGGTYSNPFQAKAEREILAAQLEGLKLDNLGKAQDLLKGGKNPVVGGARPHVPSAPYAASIDKSSSAGKDPVNILDYTYVEGQDGGYYVVPSESAKERSEDNFVQERLWDWRNYVKPALNQPPPPPQNVKLKAGYEWDYSPTQAAYFQVPTNRRKRGWDRMKQNLIDADKWLRFNK